MVDAVGSLVTSLTDYEKSIVDAMAMQKEITAKHDAYDTTLVRVRRQSPFVNVFQTFVALLLLVGGGGGFVVVVISHRPNSPRKRKKVTPSRGSKPKRRRLDNR